MKKEVPDDRNYESIYALFDTLDPISIPPYCPKEGEIYLYKWEDDFHKDDWRSDGYRWRQNGSVKSHKRVPGLSKKFFQVKINCCTGRLIGSWVE